MSALAGHGVAAPKEVAEAIRALDARMADVLRMLPERGRRSLFDRRSSYEGRLLGLIRRQDWRRARMLILEMRTLVDAAAGTRW